MNKSMVIASLSLMVFIPGMMPAQDMATILRQAQKEEKLFHDPEALANTGKPWRSNRTIYMHFAKPANSIA